MGISQIREHLSKVIPFSEIKAELANRKLLSLERFYGSSSAFLVAGLSATFDHIVVLFPDEEQAQFFSGDLEVLGVPDVHFFPGTNNKPYQQATVDNSATLVQRAEVLDAVTTGSRNLLVAEASSICEKVISPQAFAGSSIELKRGLHIEMEVLREKLIDSGYSEVQFVNKPGELAVRGGIFDIFPFSGEYPVRLEFFGDEIDSLRHFDADSQRSVSFLDQTRIVPNTSAFNQGTRESLLSYFPKDTVFIVFDDASCCIKVDRQFEAAEEVYKELIKLEKSLKKDTNVSGTTTGPAPALPLPDQLYLPSEQFMGEILKAGSAFLGEARSKSIQYSYSFNLNSISQPHFNSSFKMLRSDIEENSLDNFITYILCDSVAQRERIEELLGEPSEKLNYSLSINTLHEGFVLKKHGLAVYTDHQIFNRYHRPKTRKRKYSGGISFKELKDLNIGDYVVHVDYGIGKFAGFQKIKVKDTVQEVVVLKYQQDSVLYVNVSSLYKIQKYSGKDGHEPRITKLGSGEWARKKASAKRKVKDIARELIQLYAKRKAQKAHQFPPDNFMQMEMEAAFMYEETPDQLKAIEDVKSDMEKDMPMDRLVCGDVGFGKTEVAVRAAFKAASDGKQVGVLVPTTILADQHYKTFKKRIGDMPINVDLLSRFRTAAEQKETLKKLREGQVDILIGTHRITSKDVEFRDLGLLVIDEEQRFGVATKEKIKRFRYSVDTLTLTATPIPRTLQYSLMGARDLSVISTPPPNRQPVLTELISFDPHLIQEAIHNEVSRGGQVFFIHNRVQNIEEVAGMIMNLAPNIKVRFAHGQMKGPQLEKIIMDFYEHKFDVLVSTNIVENGIDIENANTIIINHADRFGLSELHQLRGRVGRSNRKAYCYLITPPLQNMATDSRKRLLALVEFSDLGSGFNIAMRDLDIRGAGNILGGEQSGFISDIGFELYQKVLNDAVKELKESEFSELFKGQIPEVELPETTVEFDLGALLPQWYVSDNVERLNLYRRLSTASEITEIEEWEQEVADRFGKIPPDARNLIDATRIKVLASRLLLTKVTIRAGRVWLVCPPGDTEAGKKFYSDNYMQRLIGSIQEIGKEVSVAQKDQAIRIIVQQIPGLPDCIKLLEELVEIHEKEAEEKQGNNVTV
ncbi:MAG: transcription-repair coupling factor [Balneolales bacterium]|nr:transcription-repair coupling factor [Balneolales bacterium]